MTYKDIAAMVKSFGLPYAYYQFEEGSGQQCPFVVFYYPNREDFIADGVNYVKKTILTIELYTDSKDFAAEANIEDALEAHEMVYSKEETYIDSEKMFEVIYDMEVCING